MPRYEYVASKYLDAENPVATFPERYKVMLPEPGQVRLTVWVENKGFSFPDPGPPVTKGSFDVVITTYNKSTHLIRTLTFTLTNRFNFDCERLERVFKYSDADARCLVIERFDGSNLIFDGPSTVDLHATLRVSTFVDITKNRRR